MHQLLFIFYSLQKLLTRNDLQQIPKLYTRGSFNRPPFIMILVCISNPVKSGFIFEIVKRILTDNSEPACKILILFQKNRLLPSYHVYSVVYPTRHAFKQQIVDSIENHFIRLRRYCSKFGLKINLDQEH